NRHALVRRQRESVLFPSRTRDVSRLRQSEHPKNHRQCGGMDGQTGRLTKKNSMRLWTLHPKNLDAKELVALCREPLLAQKVLRGKTKGYRHRPQLIRFQAHAKPVAALAAFLKAVHEEATRRGYNFDGSKIARVQVAIQLDETDGQLLYEWEHLRNKLKQRA